MTTAGTHDSTRDSGQTPEKAVNYSGKFEATMGPVFVGLHLAKRLVDPLMESTLFEILFKLGEEGTCRL